MQKKKSFRSVDNPAAAFISSNEPVHERHGSVAGRSGTLLHESDGSSGAGPKKRNESETKSKRLNLLIRPSLMDDFTKIAYMRRTSINDLINRLVDECVERDASLIDDYDRLFNNIPNS
ncbi:MAG: hypothetical protein HGB36_10510 [Chlorobiaceae bacterium]|nr:hypothetical protein [Chlorobiaceae bacterium]